MTSLHLPTNSTAGPFSGDKVLLHADTLSALMRGEIPPPITVELDLTNACQLDCPYCTNAEYRKGRESLPYELATELLVDMAQMGVKAVTFTGGGEPLIHPQASELIAAAQDLGMDVALITNGLLLSHVDLRAIVESCTWIRVSVDAYDRASYLASKGRDEWQRLVDNIGRLVEARNTWNPGCTVGLGYLTDDERAHGFLDFARLWRDSGVDYVQARPITYLPGDERAALDGPVIVQTILEAARGYAHDGYQVLASTPKYADMHSAQRGYAHCSGVYFACVVGATGDVWVCCHMRGDARFSLGNVKDRLLSEIWTDAETRNRVYGRIDVEECMPLCRFHATNKLLAGVNWFPVHRNFL